MNYQLSFLNKKYGNTYPARVDRSDYFSDDLNILLTPDDDKHRNYIKKTQNHTPGLVYINAYTQNMR